MHMLLKPTKPAALHEFDNMLDKMIELQHEERACILERRTSQLPTASQSIEFLGLRLQSMEPDLRRELDKADMADTNTIKSKLAQIQRLALQNRSLMEHSLYYLKRMMQQVLQQEAPLETYTSDGHVPEEETAGALLQTEI